jgi:hypothetical protein
VYVKQRRFFLVIRNALLLELSLSATTLCCDANLTCYFTLVADLGNKLGETYLIIFHL